MIYFHRARKYSSIDEKTFDDSISNYDKIKTKSFLKKILYDYDLSESRQDVESSHSSSLNKFFTSDENHPLLSKCGRKYETLISWMIASTDTQADKVNQPRFKLLPTWCRLCKDKASTESRKHLLTDCPATVHLITSFSEEMKHMFPVKYEEEFCSLNDDNLWLWILGGGTLTYNATRKQGNKFRVLNISRNPFSLGASVSQGVHKDSPAHCLKAYDEFKDIESQRYRERFG